MTEANKWGNSRIKKKQANMSLGWALMILVLAVIIIQEGCASQGPNAGISELHSEPEGAHSLPTNSTAEQTKPVTTSEDIHLFCNAYYPFDENLSGDEALAAVDRNVRYAAEHYDVNLVSWYNLHFYPDLITRFHRYNAYTMVLMEYGSFSCLREMDDWYDDADQNHPEWFLEDSEGNRINWDGWPDHWFMDIGNPDYQDYWVAHMIAKAQDVPASEDGWDGVYIDNVFTAMFGGLESNTTYVTDAAYEQAAHSYLANAYAQFQRAGIPILINLGPVPSVYSYADWASLTDGIKIEHFVSSWAGYHNSETWERQVSGLEEIGRAGKISTVYPKFIDDNLQARIYGLASYLLGRQGPHDFFYYQIQDTYTWFPPLWFTEWETAIGYPIRDRYKDQGVWQRDYSRGKVLVNPTSGIHVVDLGRTYQRLDGVAVSRIVLREHEGAMLLLLPPRAFLPNIMRW